MDAEKLSRRLGKASSVLVYAGVFALFIMMTLTTVDVLGRYLFSSPILGVFEVTEFLVLIVIFSFLAYTQSQKSHVAVDLLVTRFPKRVQRWLEIINHILCLIFMILITWMGILKALELKDIGETSPNLLVPNYPFVFFLVLGCMVMCIEYVRNLIQLISSRKENLSS